MLADLEAVIDDTGASITVEPLPAVWADRNQMRQLFQNLLANAIKFRRPDSRPTVWIEADAGSDGSDGSSVVTVRDDGIGFDPAYAERIFGVFERLHGQASYEGAGMGLATCRKIVERNGGSITARSNPGEGATFTITLRSAPAPAPAISSTPPA